MFGVVRDGGAVVILSRTLTGHHFGDGSDRLFIRPAFLFFVCCRPTNIGTLSSASRALSSWNILKYALLSLTYCADQPPCDGLIRLSQHILISKVPHRNFDPASLAALPNPLPFLLRERGFLLLNCKPSYASNSFAAKVSSRSGARVN